MANPVHGGSDPSFALASLLVERDNLRAALDDETLRAAHDEERRALAREVALLHEAADDVRVGALVTGGMTALGAGMSAYFRGITPPACDDAAKRILDAKIRAADGFAELGGAAGSLLGEAARADAEADAKQAAAAGSDAGARAEEARLHRERMDREVERGLDAVGRTLEAESQGNLAIIANV